MGMTYDLTALLVQNGKTQEIKAFPLTRAGIYSLAKFSATSIDNCSVVDALDYLINSNNIFKNILGSWIFNRIKTDLCRVIGESAFWLASYRCLNIKYLNVVQAKDMKWYFKSDVFTFHNIDYPRKWRKYLNRCDECGCIFFDQVLIEKDHNDSILHYIRSDYIGIDGYCNDCFDRSDLIQCEDCGRIIDRDEATYVDGDPICDDCLHNGDYCCCDYCGEWFRSDSDYAQFPEDHCYCSSKCCENDGWHWSERYEEWRSDYDDDYDNEVDEIVSDYHSHYYEPQGEPKKNQKHNLYIGRETEVDGVSRYDFDYDYYDSLLKMLDNKCFFETDGSLNEGFEIISQPMTEKLFFETDWAKAFNKLISDGWRSHDTSTCGTHYHYSVWYLGYTEKQQKDSAKKICRFFQLYADDIKKIARRDYNHYCMNLNNFRGGEINSKTDFLRLANDRYWAVNLTNMDNHRSKATIEIRICKGTLKASTMLASADLFLHIVRNAKSIPWKDIKNLSRWLKGIKDKNTIDYIKARHAFVGAF